MCDLKAVEIILTFSVGGITLRGLIALVKSWLKLQGIAALLLAVVMCTVASAAYLFIVHQFDWACLLTISLSVFSGTQIVYQATTQE